MIVNRGVWRTDAQRVFSILNAAYGNRTDDDAGVACEVGALSFDGGSRLLR